VESPLQHGSFDMHTGATPPPSYAGRPRAGAEKEMELVSSLVNAEAAAEQTISSKVSTLRVQLGLEDGPLIEIVQQAVAKLGLGEQVARSNIAQQVDACLAVCMTASTADLKVSQPAPQRPVQTPGATPMLDTYNSDLQDFKNVNPQALSAAERTFNVAAPHTYNAQPDVPMMQHQPGMPSPAVPQMAPKFDPETGRLVEQVVHRFDPNTGLPLPKFDPHTGRQNY